MEMPKNKIACFLIMLIFVQSLVLPAFAAPAPAIELELNAGSAVLIDAENGTLLYEKDSRVPRPPASLTKLMTLLLVMEDLKSGLVDWDTMVTVSEQAWKTGGSQMFLNIGQQVSFRDLIKGITIVSANDACVAVAEYLSGSEAAFVQRMNRRAAELGLENSHFTNSHGMDAPDHYMSALDVARLSAYLIRTQPEATAFQSEKEFTFNEIRQFNLNPLLGNFPGADGLKTGSTPGAGYCLAATSKQQGMRLISVVMNTASEEERREDSIALLNHGFRNFEMKTLYEENEVVAELPVKRGQKRAVGLVAEGPVQAVVPRNDSSYKIIEEFELPDAVDAPVKEGDIIGTLRLKSPEGELIAEVDLAAQESLERLGFFPNLLRRAGDFFAGLWQRIWPF